ncbi:MAG: hypothetical protein J6U38_02660 [Clostridia bacterium]|nr:hypothetical protein [Clostridia bacterium]
MKKLFAAIVVLAMLVSMCAVVSYANTHFQIDGAYLTNDSDPVLSRSQPWVPVEGEKDVAAGSAAGDLGSIYGLGFSYFHIQGWWGDDDDDYTDIGYQFNDGEITWGQIQVQPELAAAAGFKYCARYNVTLPIQEGSVDVKFYKMVGDKASVIHTISYVNEEPTGTVFERKSIGNNDASPANAVWLNEDGEYFAVKFTTTGEIGGVEFSYWASNPDTGTGPRGSVKIEFYAFDTNADTTLSKAPVYAQNFDWIGDNNPALSFQFEDKLAAGTYILKVTIFGETATGVDKETAYIVFPDAVGDVDDSKFEFINTNDHNVNITLFGADNISNDAYFAANPADGAAPSDGTPATPDTGDSVMVIFALVAVLALAATVVLKKRSF